MTLKLFSVIQSKSMVHSVLDTSEQNTTRREDTVCFIDLDNCSDMIIFEPFLTIFATSIKFCGNFGSCTNWLELQIESPYSKSVKHSVHFE